MTRRARDNSAQFIERILPFVQTEGARNLGTIAHELSMPYQTVFFRMAHLRDIGISVVPIVDVNRLGLDRVRVSFELGIQRIPDLGSFFRALNENAGLRYYSRSLNSRRFDCEFNIPYAQLDALTNLFAELSTMKILAHNFSHHRVLWKDFPELKPKFFDYPNGAWDVDFSALSGDPKAPVPSKSEPAPFDYKDLLVIKELEINPWIKLVDLAHKVGMPVRDVSYHFNRHVRARGLLRGFRFQWIGSAEAWSKHGIVGITYIFRDISDEDTRHMISILTPLPFLWSHTRTRDGVYLAEILAPISNLVETTSYISRNLQKINVFPASTINPDWSCTSNFTIPYQLFNSEKGGWAFSTERAMAALIQTLRPSARRGAI